MQCAMQNAGVGKEWPLVMTIGHVLHWGPMFDHLFQKLCCYARHIGSMWN